MTKLILPTSIDFDLTVILSHLKGNKVKMDFTPAENSLIDTGWEGPFHPAAVIYDAAVNRTNYNELEDEESKNFADSLRFLAVEAVSQLINGQAKIVADINEFANTAAYLIEWAQDDNEIPVGKRGKVLLHCSAGREGNRYVVTINATSPAYSF